jgi:hypothetical protein
LESGYLSGDFERWEFREGASARGSPSASHGDFFGL